MLPSILDSVIQLDADGPAIIHNREENTEQETRFSEMGYKRVESSYKTHEIICDESIENADSIIVSAVNAHKLQAKTMRDQESSVEPRVVSTINPCQTVEMADMSLVDNSKKISSQCSTAKAMPSSVENCPVTVIEIPEQPVLDNCLTTSNSMLNGYDLERSICITTVAPSQKYGSLVSSGFSDPNINSQSKFCRNTKTEKNFFVVSRYENDVNQLRNCLKPLRTKCGRVSKPNLRFKDSVGLKPANIKADTIVSSEWLNRHINSCKNPDLSLNSNKVIISPVLSNVEECEGVEKDSVAPSFNSDTLSIAYNCSLCSFSTITKDEYKMHFKEYHPGYVYVCAPVHKRKLLSDSQKFHKRIKLTDECKNDQDLKCFYCSKTFLNKGLYSRHIRSHFLKYKCKICGKIYTSELGYKNHLNFHNQRNRLHDKDSQQNLLPDIEIIDHNSESEQSFNHSKSNSAPPESDESKICSSTVLEKDCMMSTNSYRHKSNSCQKKVVTLNNVSAQFKSTSSVNKLNQNKNDFDLVKTSSSMGRRLRCSNCGDLRDKSFVSSLTPVDAGHHKSCLSCNRGLYKAYLEDDDCMVLPSNYIKGRSNKVEKCQESTSKVCSKEMTGMDSMSYQYNSNDLYDNEKSSGASNESEIFSVGLFACDCCDKFVKDLGKHVRRVHKQIRIQCNVCGKSVKKDCLSAHKNRFHSRVSQVKCHHCVKIFKSVVSLNEHLTRVKNKSK